MWWPKGMGLVSECMSKGIVTNASRCGTLPGLQYTSPDVANGGRAPLSHRSITVNVQCKF